MKGCLKFLGISIIVLAILGYAGWHFAFMYTPIGAGDRAIAAAKRRDYETAVKEADVLLALLVKGNSRGASAGYFLRGMIRMEMGDGENGLADLNQALKLNPKSSDSYKVRAAYYINKEDFDQAVIDINQYAKYDPDGGKHAAQMLAVVQYCRNKPPGDEAAVSSALKSAAMVDGKYDYDMFVLAWFLDSKQGSETEATEELKKYIRKVAPDDKDSYLFQCARFLAGQTSEEKLLDFAEKANKREKLGNPIGSARLSIGMKAAVAGDDKTARECLTEVSAQTGSLLNMVPALARGTLRRLKAP